MNKLNIEELRVCAYELGLHGVVALIDGILAHEEKTKSQVTFISTRPSDTASEISIGCRVTSRLPFEEIDDAIRDFDNKSKKERRAFNERCQNFALGLQGQSSEFRMLSRAFPANSEVPV